jgi:hypothetical protein
MFVVTVLCRLGRLVMMGTQIVVMGVVMCVRLSIRNLAVANLVSVLNAMEIY